MILFLISYLLISSFIFYRVSKAFFLKDKKLAWQKISINKHNTGFLIILVLGILAFVIPFYRVSASIPNITLTFLLIWYVLRYLNLREAIALLKRTGIGYWILFSTYIVFIIVHTIIFNGDLSKLSLAILPLIYYFAFTLVSDIRKDAHHWLGQCFVLGSALFVPFILGIGLFRFNDLSWNSFFYTDLLDPVKANPITHAFYYNIALILSAQFFRGSKDIKKKMSYGFLMFVFVIMLILFGSKIGYITTVCSLFFLGLKLFTKPIFKLAFFVLFPLSIFFVSTQVPYVEKKISGFQWQINQHEVISIDNQLPRRIIWSEAVSLIQEKPLLGHGFGQVYDSLEKRYEAIGYTKGIANRFNAHNQFLESTLQLGIFGLLWWIITLSYLIILAVKKRDPWLAYFLFTAIAYLSVESLLESQMGTVGFSFFLAYFLLNPLSKKTISSTI